MILLIFPTHALHFLLSAPESLLFFLYCPFCPLLKSSCLFFMFHAKISFAKPSINCSPFPLSKTFIAKVQTYCIIIVYFSLLRTELFKAEKARWSWLMYVSTLYAYLTSKTEWIWHLDSRKAFDFNVKVFQCWNFPYCKIVHTNFLQLRFVCNLSFKFLHAYCQN